MPIAPKVACRCGKLDCQEHSAKANRKVYDKARSSDPLRKIYSTARWQRQRAFVLARDPLCRMGKICVERSGVRMPSADVDHIVSLRNGGDPWDPDNLAGVCHACHTWKTGLESQQGPQGVGAYLSE